MYNSHNEPFTSINMMSACVYVFLLLFLFITHVSEILLNIFIHFSPLIFTQVSLQGRVREIQANS